MKSGVQQGGDTFPELPASYPLSGTRAAADSVVLSSLGVAKNVLGSISSFLDKDFKTNTLSNQEVNAQGRLGYKELCSLIHSGRRCEWIETLLEGNVTASGALMVSTHRLPTEEFIHRNKQGELQILAMKMIISALLVIAKTCN